MNAEGKLRIAVVGLKFGSWFVPAYLRHPDVAEVGIVEVDADLLRVVGDDHDIHRRFSTFEQLLEEDGWDAVHIVTPVGMHAQHSIAAMQSGLHVACAVPAAVSISELEELLRVQRETGRNYMMMETAVFTQEFLFAKALYDDGVLGRVQLLRGAHYQDMEGWADYWSGLPPMHYATHALGPLLHLVDGRVSSVSAVGSGRMADQRQAHYGNPFPIETAHFRLEGEAAEGVVAEVTRSLFETAVAYEESFDVYGDRASFIWGRPTAGERHAVVHLGEYEPGGEGRPATIEYPEIRPRPDLLPAELAQLTEAYQPVLHLAHEFVRSTLEGRRPLIDARRAADWTAPGLIAHLSALQGGKQLQVPHFN